MKNYFQHDFDKHTIFQIPALRDNYVYMITLNNKAWVFDPGDSAPVQKVLDDRNLTLESIYITHHHYDHVDGISELVKKWSCPVYGHELDKHRIPHITNTLNDKDMISIATLDAKVIFLPGHTHGLIAFYFKDKDWLFSNDLVFSLGCGRLFEGTAKQMQKSLSFLIEIPEETLLMISHEYTVDNLNFCLSQFPKDKALLNASEGIYDLISKKLPTVPTTVKYQKENNPFLRWSDISIRAQLGMIDSEDWQVFAEIRARKDIS